MTGIFMDQTRPTLLAVSAASEADASLTSARRGAIRSAINTLCQIMRMSPAMVPADLNFIRRKLQGISPAAADVKEKRFSTVKSQVAFALRHLGLTGKGTYLTPMVGEWAALWRRLPDKYARTALSRFFRYASARHIHPADVTDMITDECRQALIEESFVKDPRVNHQNLCRVWNSMIGVVDGWPEVRLAVPRYAEHYILPPDTFPSAFWQDVDAWLANQALADLLNLNAPPRPLKPRTLRQYRYEVRRFASMLVLRGHDAKAITALAYLVQPKSVEDGLRFLLERNGSKPMRSAADVASMLAKIARYWVEAPAEQVALINRYARNVMPRGEGLGRKNRLRIAPLRDPKNLVRLFLLPQKICKEVEQRTKATCADALLMQHAAALSILTYARFGSATLLRSILSAICTGPAPT